MDSSPGSQFFLEMYRYAFDLEYNVIQNNQAFPNFMELAFVIQRHLRYGGWSLNSEPLIRIIYRGRHKFRISSRNSSLAILMRVSHSWLTVVLEASSVWRSLSSNSLFFSSARNRSSCWFKIVLSFSISCATCMVSLSFASVSCDSRSSAIFFDLPLQLQRNVNLKPTNWKCLTLHHLHLHLVLPWELRRLLRSDPLWRAGLRDRDPATAHASASAHNLLLQTRLANQNHADARCPVRMWSQWIDYFGQDCLV